MSVTRYPIRFVIEAFLLSVWKTITESSESGKKKVRRVKRHTLADKNAENGILICRNPAVTKRFNLLLHSG